MGSVPDDQASAKSEEFSGPRVKFLCSHGGKILPKSDGQLRYVGGDTRLVSVNRNIGFAELMAKLEKLFGSNLWLKYQLPSEDLDALISVTCDEDVENMMDEYDRNEARDGASRLRAFLFPRVRTYLPRVPSEVLDESKSPKSSEQRYIEAMNGPRTLLKIRSDSSPRAFQVPDYLFGLEPGFHHHHLQQQQQQQDGDNLSPTHFESPTDKGPSMVPSIPSLKDTPVVPPSSQADYSRQQSSWMDTGGRGPALTTSALGPLISNAPVNPHHMWETKKIWDAGTPGEQRDEKRPIEMNVETNYNKLQRDMGVEAALARVPSKDRLVSNYMEGSHPDPHLMTDRQGKLQQMERQKPEDIHMEVSGALSEMRQECAMGGGSRFQKASEMQRGVPQSNLGVATAEMQWGMPQPNVGVIQGFDVVPERPPESRRNSADSDQEMHRRMEGQVVVENVAHPHPITTTTEVQADGFKFQDAHDVYRAEETMVLQQQQRHGEFEVSSQLHSQQLEASQHMHHLGKGHFQQVYWQMRDPQEQQQQQTLLHEPIRVVHSTPGMQRLVQPLNSHLPHSAAAGVAHHHRVPSAQNNVRTMPRADTLPNTRLPSPLYRQVPTSGPLRPDPQQLPRAPSPLRDHPPSNGPPMPSRYGPRVQIHEMGSLPSAVVQQSSGLPVPQAYMDPSDPQSFYDQCGGQLHYPEKVMKGNHDAAVGHVHYPDKILMANHDVAMGQVHYADENMKTSQYMRISTFQDT